MTADPRSEPILIGYNKSSNPAIEKSYRRCGSRARIAPGEAEILRWRLAGEVPRACRIEQIFDLG
jgi:hypothetical protein